jgi:hypothetical protein
MVDLRERTRRLVVRGLRPLVLGVCALACAPAGCRSESPPPPTRIHATVTRLEAPRQSPGAYGREGDLLLEEKPFGVLTFAAHPDAPGHRPLRGALVDVGLDATDRSDPLVSWRPGWRAAAGAVHVGPMAAVDEVECQGARGVHLGGVVDGVRLDTSICPTESGYRATTSARDLPDGAALVDEVNAGTAHVVAEDTPTRLDGDRASRFFGVTDDIVGWLLESPQMHVIGRLIRIGEQAFPSPFTLQYPGATAVRTFRVVGGDGFALLEHIAGERRLVEVGIEGERGQAAVLDDEGKALVVAPVPATGRSLSVPIGVGTDLVLYDQNGVEAGRAPLEASLHTLVAKPPPRAELSFRYTDGDGSPLPVHVMFRGLGGTRDPEPVARARSFAGGRSLYLVGGTGSVALPPGRYRVTATHGVRYTLSVSELELRAGDTRAVEAALRDVFPASPWTSGDFHLHAAPSPDAPVSLDARVASLVCEGLDLAVATDHNRVTDYGPSVERLGVAARIVTLPGDEITSYGKALWGHFNLYPLAVPTGAPEDAVSPYYELDPAAVFAAARGTDADAGRILQVNHPRMDPRIGYFDLTHLDAKTGTADGTFSGNFDAVEAFNGFWVTNPAKVREGAVDLVALARRGLHVAATGNSDSHHLLYEEAGYPRTYVHVARDPIATRGARVLSAIRARDTTVSSGPLVEMTVDGAPIGSVVVPKNGRSVRVHVRVTAPAWVPVEHVEVWHDDRVAFHVDVTRPPVDGLRFDGETVLSFPADGTILAWATSDSPLPDVLPYANARATGFTGLVYVDANGDGKVEVPPR